MIDRIGAVSCRLLLWGGGSGSSSSRGRFLLSPPRTCMIAACRSSGRRVVFGPLSVGGGELLVLGILLRRRLLAVLGLAGVVADVTVAELGGFKEMKSRALLTSRPVPFTLYCVMCGLCALSSISTTLIHSPPCVFAACTQHVDRLLQGRGFVLGPFWRDSYPGDGVVAAYVLSFTAILLKVDDATLLLAVRRDNLETKVGESKSRALRRGCLDSRFSRAVSGSAS